MNTTTKIFAALLLLTVIYIGFSTPGKVVINESGDITGIINIAREWIQGTSFWQGQLNTITTKINLIKAESAQDEKWKLEDDRFFNKEKQENEKMYRDFPETRPSDAERQVQELRERADSIELAEWIRKEENERLERIAKLRKIYSLIENRAR